jgi:prepilin-type N-terminal cleavage/methylation domain-containing protein
MSRHDREHGSRSGFTLMETIAAIVIMAVAVPPMLYTVRQAHAQRINPVLASKARWLATERLEDVIADRHSATRGYDYLITANYADETPVAGFAAFTRTVAFTETLADLSTPGDGYKRVTVSVSWTDSGGTARSLSIATVVTEYDA